VILKAVSILMEDYQTDGEVRVAMVKVLTKDGHEVLILSEMMGY
jgi:hypothetical protein